MKWNNGTTELDNNLINNKKAFIVMFPSHPPFPLLCIAHRLFWASVGGCGNGNWKLLSPWSIDASYHLLSASASAIHAMPRVIGLPPRVDCGWQFYRFNEQNPRRTFTTTTTNKKKPPWQRRLCKANFAETAEVHDEIIASNSQRKIRARVFYYHPFVDGQNRRLTDKARIG